MIHSERVEALNHLPSCPGDYILYWMQASQRARCNHALEYAVRQANERSLPLVCAFGLTPGYPEASPRIYRFMLEGLRGTAAALEARGIGFVCRMGRPDGIALDLANRAAALVTDRGYTRVQRAWRARVAGEAPCPVVQVESDVIVPVQTVSNKEEYAARTIRPRIHRLWEDFLVPLQEHEPRRKAPEVEGIDLEDMEGILAGLGMAAQPHGDEPPTAALVLAQTTGERGAGGAPHGAPGVAAFHGGASQAQALLQDFLEHRLSDYDELRNDPSLDYVSHMSPYLHFGQISPLTIALAVIEARSPGEEAFLEELIVRRELSMNFTQYNGGYDSFDCLPDWAQSTLLEHAEDPREYLYTEAELEGAQTHDPYWNAAQREMVLTGKMQGYMRMYWGKKILEWTADPREAFALALRLNNRYELDGRDPNSFAGVAWCFGKHDRPWTRRPIFGTVRYMNDKGLKRKFDMEAYLKKVEGLG